MSYLISSLSYLFKTSILRKSFLLANAYKYGLKFKVAARDVVGRTIYKNGCYEKNITTYLTKQFVFKKNQVFIDIGANIGWYSLLLSKLPTGPKKIYSFEPDVLNFKLLTENIALNESMNVEAFPCALSDEIGTKSLYLYSSRNFGRHSLLPINEGNVAQVKSTTLDHFWSESAGPDEEIGLIKIDTEGYELQVVQGGRNVLGSCPAVLSEYSPGFMKKGGMEPDAFLDLMFQHGFSPSFIDKEGKLSSASREALSLLDGDGVNLLWLKTVDNGAV